MEYTEGQEFIQGAYSENRHFKVLGTRNIYTVSKGGKRSLSRVLVKMENLTIKREDFKNWSDYEFDKLKFFEISTTELDRLIRTDILKLKE